VLESVGVLSAVCNGDANEAVRRGVVLWLVAVWGAVRSRCCHDGRQMSVLMQVRVGGGLQLNGAGATVSVC
jgi:hypothetical protein